MIENTVRHIYALLLNRQYIELEELSSGFHLNAKEIEISLKEYDCELVSYPDSISIDSIEVIGSQPKEWSVVAPIYTKEEGLSDLSIELSLTETSGPSMKVELHNVRVR